MKKKQMEEGFIRILDTDIPINKNVYVGLTKIKGISFALSNAICNYLGIDKFKKIKDLSEEEIEKLSRINEIIKNFPPWILNRRRERESGKDLHLFGSRLDLAKEFDIRRLKKIKCYRGVRHSLGLPVRGQRTKSHFRKGPAVGVLKAKSKKR
jgi:small subunit ribosomal protein S13